MRHTLQDCMWNVMCNCAYCELLFFWLHIVGISLRMHLFYFIFSISLIFGLSLLEQIQIQVLIVWSCGNVKSVTDLCYVSWIFFCSIFIVMESFINVIFYQLWLWSQNSLHMHLSNISLLDIDLIYLCQFSCKLHTSPNFVIVFLQDFGPNIWFFFYVWLFLVKPCFCHLLLSLRVLMLIDCPLS